MYKVRMGGVTTRADSPTEAVHTMITNVTDYLERLENRGLSMHHAEWDMFLDDLRAVAEMPWLDQLDSKLIEGPGQVYWGWGRVEE